MERIGTPEATNNKTSVKLQHSLLHSLKKKKLSTGCFKMMGAVFKLIIFTSMVNRIINTSRNERVTQQVYDTLLQMFDVCTLRHTAHFEAIVQRTWPTRSPDLTPWGLLPLGLREGQSVCATTTREHT